MSKHVWRMHSKYNMMYGIQAIEPDLTDKANCTLVPDEACFPVKEAMRLCKAVKVWEQRGIKYNYGDALEGLYNAHINYEGAVARMKERNKKDNK